jgi:hypothetical protein
MHKVLVELTEENARLRNREVDREFMDALSKHNADIALSFGLPPELIGNDEE